MKTHKTIGIFAAIICVGIIGAVCANNPNNKVELTDLQKRNLETLADDFKKVVLPDGRVIEDGTKESTFPVFIYDKNKCEDTNGNCHLTD